MLAAVPQKNAEALDLFDHLFCRVRIERSKLICNIPKDLGEHAAQSEKYSWAEKGVINGACNDFCPANKFL